MHGPVVDWAAQSGSVAQALKPEDRTLRRKRS